MTKLEQRLDTLIMMLKNHNIYISPSGIAKIKKELLSSAKEGFWHDAQGDVLPEIDREVIVLCINGKVCFGHRPNTNGYVIVDGENLYPQTYNKGGWNIPDVKWWMDIDLPNLEE